MTDTSSPLVPIEGQSSSTAGNSHELAREVAAFSDIVLDNQNFDYYERQFQEVLMGIENDEVLEAFRSEYAALHHAFLKSHDAESRLLKKCSELQADIESCATKVHAAEELTQGDKNTIERLRIEIDKTHKKCCTSRERELVLKDKVNCLKRELRDIEERSHLPVEATALEAALQSLIRGNETVMKEKETLEYQLSALQQSYATSARRLERLLETKRERDAELRAVCDAVDEKVHQTEAQKAIRLRKEEELRRTRELITRHMATTQERQAMIERLNEGNDRHTMEIKCALDETARLTETYQQLSHQLQNVNRTSQTCNEENDALQRRMNELAEELKVNEAAVGTTSRAHQRELKLLEAAKRRNAVMVVRCSEAEATLNALHTELQMQEEEFAAVARGAAADEKLIATLSRQRVAVQNEFIDAVSKAEGQATWLSERRAEAHHLEHELHYYAEHAQKQNEGIYKLTHECTNYEQQIKTAAVQCANVMLEVQSRERQIAEALGEVKDLEVRVQQQQSLMDAMLTERKAYAKHYTQLKTEVTEMAKRFKIILVQIKRMQEEVVRRERRLVDEDGVIETLTQQKRELEAQIGHLHMCSEKSAHAVQLYRQDLRRLGDVFTEGEEEVGRQRRRYRGVQKERDLLSVQVVERNEELARTYEKVQVQTALLQRGGAMYEELLRTIQQLHQQTAQVSDEVARLRHFVQRLPELQVLVNTAWRELRQEKLRVESLLRECERPMNLHPNHQLSWSDPAAFELTEKVNKLQRELVTRRAELSEKEKCIREREQNYLQSKATVARQLGPEMAEQITVYQGNLTKKAGQMRAMMASLKYFREQTEIYQDRYDELHATLDRLAETYVERRKRQGCDTASPASCADGSSSNKMYIGDGSHPQEEGKGEEEERQQPHDLYVGYIAPPREKSTDTEGETGGEQQPHVEELPPL